MEEKIKQYFESHDYFANDLGAVLTECRPGHAEMELTLKRRHISGVGKNHVHAGVIYSLAESASAAAILPFGYDCVAVEGKITYVDAVSEGTLIAAAEANDGHENGNSSCRVRIMTKDSRLIANAKFGIFYTGEPFAAD